MLIPDPGLTKPKTGKTQKGKSFPWPKIIQLKTVHFFLVSFILLILPIAKEWNILLTGERVEGIVVSHQGFNYSGEIEHDGPTVRSEIQLSRGEKIYSVYGPENVKYTIGKKVPIIFSKSKPNKFILANFSGFYLQKRSVILIIVFVIWLAIYTTIVQLQRGEAYYKK